MTNDTTPAPVVTRVPAIDGEATLGGPNVQGDDYLIIINGMEVGITYWCSAPGIPRKQKWASCGPAGISKGHPTREAAEQVQVDAHLATRRR